MLVQKYGGSSVGTPEKIRNVAARIARCRSQGESVVVVVSAMGDSTDELIALASQVTVRRPQDHEREMDMLLSAGERISMALLSMALRDQGVEAISFTGSQAGIITDENHTRARIIEIRPGRIREELAKDRVVIVAGFQGVSRTKEVTTLGRGGSDTTAVALAAHLAAERCEVFTDVPGIFSADPRVVGHEAAIRYEELPLDLVLEMAAKGAQVMHPRSIEIARERSFPLFVGLAHSKNHQLEGTMLVPETQSFGMPGDGLEAPKVVAVTSKTGLKLMGFAHDQAQSVLDHLSRSSGLVHNLSWGVSGLTLLVDPHEDGGIFNFYGEGDHKNYVAVSVIGYQLQQNSQIPSKIVGFLKAEGICVAGLTCHPNSITVWFLDAKDACKRAVSRLHEAFLVKKKNA